MIDNIPTEPDLSDPKIQSLLQEAERLRVETRHLRLFTIVTSSFYLLALGYLAFRFPAASIPALLAAGVARWHFRVRPPFDDMPHWGLSTLLGRVIPWGITGGAIGYAVLSALGVGVPAPDAPFGWRVFGGLVFGAAAGVAASLVVCRIPLERKLRALRDERKGSSRGA
jgi:hypothetical protein